MSLIGKRKSKSEEGAEKEETRVNITINAKTKGHLEEVRVDTDKSTLSDVFRQAIFYYTVLFQEHKKGNEILIRDKNGNVEKLRMFM